MTEYYRADAQGEKWLKQADAILQKETIGVMSQDEIKTLAGNVALELGCTWMRKQGTSVQTFPWNEDRRCTRFGSYRNENRYEVKSWYVYDSGNYEIDDSMPVWGGN